MYLFIYVYTHIYTYTYIHTHTHISVMFFLRGAVPGHSAVPDPHLRKILNIIGIMLLKG